MTKIKITFLALLTACGGELGGTPTHVTTCDVRLSDGQVTQWRTCVADDAGYQVAVDNVAGYFNCPVANAPDCIVKCHPIDPTTACDDEGNVWDATKVHP